MIIQNFHHKIPDYTKYYYNKNVCILGTGPSLAKYDIDYTKYDTVVGCNRIFLTEYMNHVNVLYHNLHGWEEITLETFIYSLPKYHKLQRVLFSPFHSLKTPTNVNPLAKAVKKVNFDKYDIAINLTTIVGDRLLAGRPYTGLVATYHCSLFPPKSLDIYGFDFYEGEESYVVPMKEYSNNTLHHKEANKKILTEIVGMSPNYNWFQ